MLLKCLQTQASALSKMQLATAYIYALNQKKSLDIMCSNAHARLTLRCIVSRSQAFLQVSNTCYTFVEG